MITDMEANVLQETAKNAGQALEAIHAMIAKVHDDALAEDLSAPDFLTLKSMNPQEIPHLQWFERV